MSLPLKKKKKKLDGKQYVVSIFKVFGIRSFWYDLHLTCVNFRFHYLFLALLPCAKQRFSPHSHQSSKTCGMSLKKKSGTQKFWFLLFFAGSSDWTHLQPSRLWAAEGNMLWTDVFCHPVWVFFTAVLAVVVYLQRRPRWDPTVCSVRLRGKTAMVTGANAGWCHGSLLFAWFYPVIHFIILINHIKTSLALFPTLTHH